MKWLAIIVVLAGCSTTAPTAPEVDFSVPTNPLVYVHDQHLWLMDVGKLTTQPGEYFEPVWLPNQAAIMYGLKVEQSYQLWQMDLTTRQSSFLIATPDRPHQIEIAPNGQSLLYFVGQELYLLQLHTALATRLHEGALTAQWAPNSKRIVFSTTDRRLIMQDLTVTTKLAAPLVVLESVQVAAPIFLDDRTLAYEGEWEGQYTVLRVDLSSSSITPLTSLRFNNAVAAPTVQLELEPAGERIVYTRPDETTQQPNVWVFHITKDAPRLILTKAAQARWSPQANEIYYFEDSTVWRSTANGFNKTKLVPAADFIAVPNSLDV